MRSLAATAVAAAMEGDDDFNFEFGVGVAEQAREDELDEDSSSDDEESTVWPNSNTARVQRLWGIPDTSATVGSLFAFTIPADAFSGEVDSYKVRTHVTSLAGGYQA